MHVDAVTSSQLTGDADAAALLRESALGSVFRPQDLPAAGLTRDRLRSLLRRGAVEKIERGLYRRTDLEPTENHSLAVAAARAPGAIVCLLSALRVHGIGTTSSAQVWLAVGHRERPPRIESVGVRTVRFSGPARTLGVVPTEFEGVPSQMTDPTRTVLDCFRFERLVGPEVPMEALRDALRTRRTTVAALASMEEALPSRRLSAALDVWSV